MSEQKINLPKLKKIGVDAQGRQTDRRKCILILSDDI